MHSIFWRNVYFETSFLPVWNDGTSKDSSKSLKLWFAVMSCVIIALTFKSRVLSHHYVQCVDFKLCFGQCSAFTTQMFSQMCKMG